MNTSSKSIIPDRWSSSESANLEGIDLLVYQSRLLGSDPALVLWGGGNTSLKLHEHDFKGERTHVLRVKGSGSDLKSVTKRDFPALRMDDLLPLLARDDMSDEEMVEYLSHTLLHPASPRPSIETLLHAFVPAPSVVHSHADSILALTNNERAEEILSEVYGDELAIVPYYRPGFLLSKLVGISVRENPDVKGVILLNHGLITWHNDPQEAYRLHIEMVQRAAQYVEQRGTGSQHSLKPQDNTGANPPSASTLAPILRGLLGKDKRCVLNFDGTEPVRRFVSGESISFSRLAEVIEEGAATPDHILNTKRKPMLVDLSGVKDEAEIKRSVAQAYEQWMQDYTAYYTARNKGEAMLPSVPRVVLVRGLGIFSVGKDRRATTISGDIYRHTIKIIEAAEQIGRYRSLTLADAFAAEYWPLELYKLTLAPPDNELSRRSVMLTGAAGAIGAGIAKRFAAEGAHVVCADLDIEKASALAEQISAANPNNAAIAVQMDVTSEDSVHQAYNQALIEYGGIDILVSNAGIALPAPLDELTLADWERSFAVNATGHFLVAREALRIMKAQDTGGSMVFIATKNVTAPGKDFGAYSASKAAEAQLARVLALEGGPFGIRSNMVNPDAVFAGSGLWSQEVREQRARAQGISPAEIEDYYRKRNLLQAEVTADDVALAALFLASDRSAKTTGAMLPVDGGLREAFPR